MDKSFVMLVGLPGAGKSTHAEERFKKEADTVIVTPDARLENLAAEKGITYAEAFRNHLHEINASVIAEAREAFAAGKKVVWDEPNLTVEDRARKLELVPDDYFKVALVIELPKEELTDRFIGRFRQNGKAIDPEVMDKMAQDYDRPKRFEGFDYIENLS